MKRCIGCGELLELSAFYRNKGKPTPRCKRCHMAQSSEARRARGGDRPPLIWHQPDMMQEDRDRLMRANSQRRRQQSGKLNARAAADAAMRRARRRGWSKESVIRAIYRMAEIMSKLTGEQHVVDHIIPLNGELVSGLHVESNLQVITRSENSAKGNAYEIG